MLTEQEVESWKVLARSSAADPAQAAARLELARTTAETFSSVGTELHVVGHVLGTDRVRGLSPGGHGSDEIVAVSLLLRVAGQLVSASTDLFGDGRHYAAAALMRQLVEVEYLAWAFNARDNDAERWLRSTAEERRGFFTPAKLRQAAQGKFRGKDYGHHCEMGGHPVPRSAILLNGDDVICQLLLSTCSDTPVGFGITCWTGPQTNRGRSRSTSGKRPCTRPTALGRRSTGWSNCLFRHEPPGAAQPAAQRQG